MTAYSMLDRWDPDEGSLAVETLVFRVVMGYDSQYVRWDPDEGSLAVEMLVFSAFVASEPQEMFPAFLF